MSDQLQTILDLKTRAKNRRDRRRYKIAVSILDKAIAEAKEGLRATETTAGKSQFAKELSDCYGMQGGIHRRWGMEAEERLQKPEEQVRAKQERDNHLAESIKAYDEGFTFESDEAYGIVDSYNLVNRLVSRLLYDTIWLDGTPTTIPEGVKPLDKEDELDNVRAQLKKALAIIRNQLKLPRRGDIWALADLALLTLLLSEDEDAPDSAYNDFIAAVPRDYAYESAISALQPLSELDLPLKENLKKALKQLKKALKQLAEDRT